MNKTSETMNNRNTLQKVKIGRALNGVVGFKMRKELRKNQRSLSFDLVLNSTNLNNEEKIGILIGGIFLNENSRYCFFNNIETLKKLNKIYDEMRTTCYQLARYANLTTCTAYTRSTREFENLLRDSRKKTDEFFIKFLGSFMYREEEQVIDAYLLGIRSDEFKKKYPRKSKSRS